MRIRLGFLWRVFRDAAYQAAAGKEGKRKTDARSGRFDSCSFVAYAFTAEKVPGGVRTVAGRVAKNF